MWGISPRTAGPARNPSGIRLPATSLWFEVVHRGSPLRRFPRSDPVFAGEAHPGGGPSCSLTSKGSLVRAQQRPQRRGVGHRTPPPRMGAWNHPNVLPSPISLTRPARRRSSWSNPVHPGPPKYSRGRPGPASEPGAGLLPGATSMGVVRRPRCGSAPAERALIGGRRLAFATTCRGYPGSPAKRLFGHFVLPAGRRFDAAGATSFSTMRADPAGSRSLFMPASSSNPRRSSRFWDRPA